MIDAELIIVDELERLAPAEDSPSANWEDICVRARGGTRPFGRRRFAVLTLAILVAIVVPTLALSAGLRSLLGLASRPEIAKAHLLISAPVGNGYFAHLWHAPSTTGGQCSYITADGRMTPAASALSHPSGWGCSFRGTKQLDEVTAQVPLATALFIQTRLPGEHLTSWVPPIVGGHVFGGLRVQRVEIRWRGGSLRLRLKDGYFVGGSPLLYKPPFSEFPFVLVGIDTHGRVVVHHALDSPTLLRMSHGWEEYARAYHRWKQHG